MTEATISEQADRLSRRRARMLPMLAVIYLSQQGSYFATQPGERGVDHVRIGAWVLLSLVLLAGLATKGFWFRSSEIREMLDDENTKANRSEGMRWGFIAAMLGAIVLYVGSTAGAVSARQAIHVIVSLGIAGALIRFGWLERRAHRDG